MPHRCAVLRGRKCTGRGGGRAGGREGGGGGALCSLPRRDATANLRKRFPVLRDKRTTTTRRAGEEGLSGGGDRAIILPRPPPRPFPFVPSLLYLVLSSRDTQSPRRSTTLFGITRLLEIAELRTHRGSAHALDPARLCPLSCVLCATSRCVIFANGYVCTVLSYVSHYPS